jgi:hypothetical protein
MQNVAREGVFSVSGRWIKDVRLRLNWYSRRTSIHARPPDPRSAAMI